MGNLITGKIEELLVTATNEGKSKKNNDREFIMVTLADSYGNNQNIFHWLDEVEAETLTELRTWKRGDNVNCAKTYSNIA